MIRRVVVAAAAAVVLAAVLLVAIRPGASASIAACEGGDAIDFGCHERRLIALTEHGGPRAALRDLERGMKRSGYLRAACHQLVHRIGRTAGGSDGMRAFDDGDPLCASGYYHGVTEGAMGRMGPREAAAVCRDLPGRAVKHGEASCLHGMGHGFMRLLDRDLRESLRACDALRARRARRECYRGVFMENHAGVERPTPDSLRPRDPLYPCTALARRYKRDCFGRQTTYALFVSNGDFATVFRLCGATERRWRSACRRGLGGDVAAETEDVAAPAQQARARRRLCLLGRNRRARADCVRGVVELLLRDREGDPSAQVDGFCAALAARATQPEHAACLAAAESGYRRLVTSQAGGDAAAAATDFICFLKPRGGRRSSK